MVLTVSILPPCSRRPHSAYGLGWLLLVGLTGSAIASTLDALSDDALGQVAGQSGLTLTLNNSRPVTATEIGVEDDGLRLRANDLRWLSVNSDGSMATASAPVVVRLDAATEGGVPYLVLDTNWGRRRLQVERIGTPTDSYGAFVLDSSGQFTAGLYYQTGSGYRLPSTLNLTDAALFWRDDASELVLDNINFALNLPDPTLSLTTGNLSLSGSGGQVDLKVGKLWLQSDSTSTPTYSRASPGASAGGFGFAGPLGAYSFTLAGPGLVGSQGLRNTFTLTTGNTFVDHWHTGGSESLWLTGQHTLSGTAYWDLVNTGTATPAWTWNGAAVSSSAPQPSILAALRGGNMTHLASRLSIGASASAGNSLGGMAIHTPNLNGDVFLVPGGGAGAGLTAHPQITTEGGYAVWTDGNLGAGWAELSLLHSEGKHTLDLNGQQLAWTMSNGLLAANGQFALSDLVTVWPYFAVDAVFYGNASLGLRPAGGGTPGVITPLSLSLNNDSRNRITLLDDGQSLILDNLGFALDLPDLRLNLASGSLGISGSSGQLNATVGSIRAQTGGTSLGGFSQSGPLGAYSLSLSAPGQFGSEGLRAAVSLATGTFVSQWHSGGPDALWGTAQHTFSGSLYMDLSQGGATSSPWWWNGSQVYATTPRSVIAASLRNATLYQAYSRVSVGNSAIAGASLGGLSVYVPNLNADIFLGPGGASGSGLTVYPTLTTEGGHALWTDGGLSAGWSSNSILISQGTHTLDLQSGLSYSVRNGLLAANSQFITATSNTTTPLLGLDASFYGNATIGLQPSVDGRPLLRMPILFSLNNDTSNHIVLLDADGSGSLGFQNWSGLSMSSNDGRIGVENGAFTLDIGQLVHLTDARVQDVKIGNSTLGQIFMPAQSSLRAAVRIWGH